LQQSDAKETVSEEHVMQQTEAKEIVLKELSENNLAESSTESIDNEESGELSFYPPDGAEIVYGEDEVSKYTVDAILRGLSVSRFLEEADNEEAYYYVCIDTRNTDYGLFMNQDCDYSCFDLIKKELEKYFTNVKEFPDCVYRTNSMYTAYVTKEQISTLKKGFSEDPTTKQLFLALYCVPENFVEEWIYENTHGFYNGVVDFPLCKKNS